MNLTSWACLLISVPLNYVYLLCKAIPYACFMGFSNKSKQFWHSVNSSTWTLLALQACPPIDRHRPLGVRWITTKNMWKLITIWWKCTPSYPNKTIPVFFKFYIHSFATNIKLSFQDVILDWYPYSPVKSLWCRLWSFKTMSGGTKVCCWKMRGHT